MVAASRIIDEQYFRLLGKAAQEWETFYNCWVLHSRVSAMVGTEHRLQRIKV